MNKAQDYGAKEQWANRLSHGIGVILSALALLSLQFKGADQGGAALASYGVYGSSLVLLYLASTLYHSAQHPQWLRRFKLWDHCAIYLLIAGSYTPFLVVTLHTAFARWLLLAVWLLAIAGIVFKVFFINRFKKIALATYLLLGWLSLLIIYPLSQALAPTGLILLAAGGGIYSLGVIFYVAKKWPYHHAIWHLFVLVGSACHFMAIYGYVA